MSYTPRRRLLHLACFAMLALGLAGSAFASSTVVLSTEDAVHASDAVLRGTVVGAYSFKDTNGLIYTATSLYVDEGFKGTFPTVLLVVHRGGQVGNEDEFYGLSPRFVDGAEYLLFVKRGPNRRLQCTQGEVSAVQLHRDEDGEFVPEQEDLLAAIRELTSNGQNPGDDVTDQAGEFGPSAAAPVGMLGAISSRFLQPDRNEPIPYLVDAASLPAGMTLTQATNAVQQALNAWTAVTSLKFRLEAIQSFGQGADTITNVDDSKLRIQLHDNYNSITNPGILGVGGRGSLSSPLAGVGWDIGGSVNSNEFRRTSRGYVVLEATNTLMQSTSTFAEVLCHEIGHALNLAHSSEVATNDSVLTNAIMYFQAHADGRGATLGSYDPPVIRQIYPSNTPPFAFDRVMDITDASPQPNVSGINEIVLGFDLQSTNLTVFVTNVTGAANGTFTTVGTTAKYTPLVIGDAARQDPAGNVSYSRFVGRLWDGTNGSPWFSVRVISFNYDTVNPSDGIPDNWMIQYFGNANPAVGSNHRATNDFDGDGMNNIQEYRAGMVPTNSASAQRITGFNVASLQWQMKPYELYQIYCTTNIAKTNWTLTASVAPTNTVTSIGILTNFHDRSARWQFFRVIKVP